jgi:hypothetical protein
MTLEKDEFSAACMEMGIALKTQDEKDQLFVKLAEGNPEISFDQFQVNLNDACFLAFPDFVQILIGIV